MVNKLFVIMDLIAEESGPVFEAKNDGIAIRNFRMSLQKVNNVKDYVLICVGSIDHITNTVIGGLADPIYDSREEAI